MSMHECDAARVAPTVHAPPRALHIYILLGEMKKCASVCVQAEVMAARDLIEQYRAVADQSLALACELGGYSEETAALKGAARLSAQRPAHRHARAQIDRPPDRHAHAQRANT